MKKFILIIAMFLANFTFGQQMVQFKISKSFCIFNFMETTIESSRTSSTLRNYIFENTKNDTIFSNLCKGYKKIILDYNFSRNEFPENRHRARSSFDLFSIAAVKATNLEEFKNATIGILPYGEHLKLFKILNKIEPYYDKIIWNENESKIKAQLISLNTYSDKVGAIFKTFNNFYNSTWTDDIPFIVSIYPIPGKKGNTTATPHANSLCVGVLTDETDHEGRIGVVVHEMCHVLYDEQDKDFQQKLEDYFEENKSQYSKFTHNFIDEGLATALGNGWAFKNISDKLDESDWYNNEYINGFGKSLFPLVERYISENKRIDKNFINEAIRLFEIKFPKSVTDYAILLNSVSIYSDNEIDEDRNLLSKTINSNFIISSSNSSSPILDSYSLELIKNNMQTQFIIIEKNNLKNLNKIKVIIPEVKQFLIKKPLEYFNLSFIDKNNRVIIILNVKDKSQLNEELKRMKKEKYFDKMNSYRKI